MRARRTGALMQRSYTDPRTGDHEATVHGYTVAFWCAAAIFAIGAVVCGLMLRGGAPAAEPAFSPAPSA